MEFLSVAMLIKSSIVFTLSLLFFLLIAGHRFGDSGHAITMISNKGGKVRHPVHIQNKYGSCTIIVTGRVIPPYRGDARVVLEGPDYIAHNIYLSEPIIHFGFKDLPSFKNDTVYGLKPGARLALWLIIENIDRKRDETCQLVFFDTATNRPILRLPIFFEGKKKRE